MEKASSGKDRINKWIGEGLNWERGISRVQRERSDENAPLGYRGWGKTTKNPKRFCSRLEANWGRSQGGTTGRTNTTKCEGGLCNHPGLQRGRKASYLRKFPSRQNTKEKRNLADTETGTESAGESNAQSTRRVPKGGLISPRGVKEKGVGGGKTFEKDWLKKCGSQKIFQKNDGAQLCPASHPQLMGRRES